MIDVDDIRKTIIDALKPTVYKPGPAVFPKSLVDRTLTLEPSWECECGEVHSLECLRKAFGEKTNIAGYGKFVLIY